MTSNKRFGSYSLSVRGEEVLNQLIQNLQVWRFLIFSVQILYA